MRAKPETDIVRTNTGLSLSVAKTQVPYNTQPADFAILFPENESV
jgi:hypothetical protein